MARVSEWAEQIVQTALHPSRRVKFVQTDCTKLQMSSQIHKIETSFGKVCHHRSDRQLPPRCSLPEIRAENHPLINHLPKELKILNDGSKFSFAEQLQQLKLKLRAALARRTNFVCILRTA